MTYTFTRTIENASASPVVITIDCPIDEGDGMDFSCRYSITGLSKEISRSSVGIDSIQAFLLALKLIDNDLRASPEFMRGELRWLGQEGLGFSA